MYFRKANAVILTIIVFVSLGLIGSLLLIVLGVTVYVGIPEIWPLAFISALLLSLKDKYLGEGVTVFAGRVLDGVRVAVSFIFVASFGGYTTNGVCEMVAKFWGASLPFSLAVFFALIILAEDDCSGDSICGEEISTGDLFGLALEGTVLELVSEMVFGGVEIS